MNLNVMAIDEDEYEEASEGIGKPWYSGKRDTRLY